MGVEVTPTETLRYQEPLRDLDIAGQLVTEMAVATVFPDFQRAWQDFLIRIERAWEYTERAGKGERRFQQWVSPYVHQKKRDPLLAFIYHARHAETHAVAPTVDHPFKLMIRDRFGHPFRIDSIKTSLEEGVLTIDVDTAAEDSLLDYVAVPVPSSPKLVRFYNRGKWYEPPKTHLGKPLVSLHPVDVAKHGLAFYSAFVNEAKFRFCGSRA